MHTIAVPGRSGLPTRCRAGKPRDGRALACGSTTLLVFTSLRPCVAAHVFSSSNAALRMLKGPSGMSCGGISSSGLSTPILFSRALLLDSEECTARVAWEWLLLLRGLSCRSREGVLGRRHRELARRPTVIVSRRGWGDGEFDQVPGRHGVRERGF